MIFVHNFPFLKHGRQRQQSNSLEQQWIIMRHLNLKVIEPQYELFGLAILPLFQIIISHKLDLQPQLILILLG